MILITGGTGFIGRVLIRHLASEGKQVRLLLRPSLEPRLPTGIPFEVTVSSLTDPRGVLSAMRDVDVVYHLISAEREGIHADLSKVDVEGTHAIVSAAAQAGVKRLIFLSHLGADRSSAYPVLKAKGMAENIILNSSVPYTIFRSGPVFGPGDQFTETFIKLIRANPFLFFMPDEGQTLIQPIWIEDLVACLSLSSEDPQMVNQTYQVGGNDYLPFSEIIRILLEKKRFRRMIVNMQSAYLRILGLWIEQINPKSQVPLFWLDYLAADRTCSLDTLPRTFGLIPARFIHHLDYLLED